MPEFLAHALIVVVALAAAPHAGAETCDGSSPDDAHDGHDAEAGHVAEAFGLRALHGWTRATTAAETLVWVEIANTGADPVELTGAESPDAARGELVGYRSVDGAQAYEPIARVDLDPGAEIALAPFGLALRLDGLARPLVEGDHLCVTLVTGAGELPFEVAVEAADARDHSHAGHAHD